MDEQYTNATENTKLTKDTFLANVMLAVSMDDKFNIIAGKDADTLSESDWEDSLRVLSVYLNMSVCDILGIIADKRENGTFVGVTNVPDSDAYNGEYDYACAEYESECADRENYDYALGINDPHAD